MNTEVKITEDGTHTLYVPELNEHYHSTHGALQESMHVFIESALKLCEQPSLKILEVGFGTGLNALLTAHYSANNDLSIQYHAIEKFPLRTEKIRQLNYTEYFPEEFKNYFSTMHICRWNTQVEISSNFCLKKIEEDLTQFNPTEKYNIVFFDAFAPDIQPELWTKEQFSKLYDSMEVNGILTTYSSKGQVKRTLKEIGFQVELIPGPPGKREMIRAIKR